MKSVKIIKADGSTELEFINGIKERGKQAGKNVEAAVSEIIEAVRTRGDEAVREYTQKFDAKASSAAIKGSFEIPKETVRYGYYHSGITLSLEKAYKRIYAYHEKQKLNGYTITGDGIVIGQRVRPLDKVGIYVPGGTAAYPSSVLMNAVPAKVAGVNEIIMTTPPSGDPSAFRNIMCAAYLAGVNRAFSVGGAQAIAALAFGTETIPKVDKIVGPGNIYVATAKKLLYGTIDIDMIAGPSEILIVADETADPVYLAADMLSQAEHDKLASALLFCTSDKLASEVAEELEKQLSELPRRDMAQAALDNAGGIIVCDIDKAVELANYVAPEHLELMISEPFDRLDSIRNAGSVFLGRYSPEPLGDYMAGPNHVLPTSGTARFFSPLSVDSFIKKSSYIYYNKEALKAVGKDIINIAESEGLKAHANSIRKRLD